MEIKDGGHFLKLVDELDDKEATESTVKFSLILTVTVHSRLYFLYPAISNNPSLFFAARCGEILCWAQGRQCLCCEVVG